MAMKDFDPSTDTMKDWQSKVNNDVFRKRQAFRLHIFCFFQYGNPMQAMSAKSWKETPSSKMFMKLFRYIVGK